MTRGKQPNDPGIYVNVTGVDNQIWEGTMVQVLELRVKQELLKHFLSKRNTFIIKENFPHLTI